MGAMILMLGVALFSLLMGSFIEILDQYQKLGEAQDGGDELQSFFTVLKYFNNNKNINYDFREEIHEHLAYKWAKDKNQPLEDPANMQYFLMIPVKVRTQLMRDYYFGHFLEVFKTTFIIENPQGQIYTWKDDEYIEFMMQFLRDLDPRHELANSLIFDELDDINEVLFIQKGVVEIGYQLNKQRKYVVRYEDKTMIGAYNCTFNMRIIFCYRAKTLCEGMSMRKSNWIKLLNQHQEIGNLIKKNVTFDYITNIKNKINREK